MSEEAAGADKSHDPTPKKLEDARKKGDHPKSADLTIAAAYGGYYLGLTALGAGLALAAVNQLGGLLYHADGLATDAFSAPAHVVLRPLLSITSLAVLPLITVPAMLALLSLLHNVRWFSRPASWCQSCHGSRPLRWQSRSSVLPG